MAFMWVEVCLQTTSFKSFLSNWETEKKNERIFPTTFVMLYRLPKQSWNLFHALLLAFSIHLLFGVTHSTHWWNWGSSQWLGANVKNISNLMKGKKNGNREKKKVNSSYCHKRIGWCLLLLWCFPYWNGSFNSSRYCRCCTRVCQNDDLSEAENRSGVLVDHDRDVGILEDLRILQIRTSQHCFRY